MPVGWPVSSGYWVPTIKTFWLARTNNLNLCWGPRLGSFPTNGSFSSVTNRRALGFPCPTFSRCCRSNCALRGMSTLITTSVRNRTYARSDNRKGPASLCYIDNLSFCKERKKCSSQSLQHKNTLTCDHRKGISADSLMSVLIKTK